jgi:pantothenate synthetase
MSSWARSSAATTYAPAAPDADFKACCMASGAYDGANRDDYFQGVATIVHCPYYGMVSPHVIPEAA